MRFSSFLFLTFTLFSLTLWADEAAEAATPLNFIERLRQKEDFTINLKDPEFSNGVITTDKGGIVTADDMRIQAQNISYTNRIENGILIQRVEAEGDLLVEYGSHIFVAEKLEYDFVRQTGFLLNGKTFVGVWFLGGERIELKPDKTYLIFGAFITTCESQDNSWDINAKSVNISDEHFLSAKNIRLRLGNFPVFWLPTFKSNLKFINDAPIRYKLKWDKGLGPRVSMRYRVFSWQNLDMFLRLDYRLKRGFGGAIESKYNSSDGRTQFLTKSYGAHDKVIAIERGNKRFRLQGLYDRVSVDEKTQVHMTYDKFSDDKMPREFKSDDFEINTQQRSILLITHKEQNALGSLRFQPRLNTYQSLDQELPLINVTLRPFELANLGIIAENRVNAGFLDYVYNKFLSNYVENIHAVRLETKNQIYRPIHLSGITITPRVGIDAVFYDNNPFNKAIGQGVFTYGGVANSRMQKGYNSFNHMLEPYVSYEGISSPLASLPEHYIFNIDDGFSKQNLFKAGIRNSLFSKKHMGLTPLFFNDTYLYLFFHDKELPQTLAKVYSSFGINQPSCNVRAGVEWNCEENLFDYANMGTEWTINENLAFGLEFRHRSRFDWRKSNHENYILDFARSVEEMLDSPLSDGRNTLLSRIQMRLSPRVTCLFQSHNGWGRKNEPAYTAVKLGFHTLLSCRWMLRFSLQYDKAGGFVPTAAISLIK